MLGKLLPLSGPQSYHLQIEGVRFDIVCVTCQYLTIMGEVIPRHFSNQELAMAPIF